MAQANLGDCYLISSLGAIAWQDSQFIPGMFINNRDGAYTVRFYHDGQPTYVTVDRCLPVDANHKLVFCGRGAAADDAKNVLWLALVEKAFAQLNESGWLTTNGPRGVNAYEAIGQGGSGSTVLPAITGLPVTNGSPDDVGTVNLSLPTVAYSREWTDANVYVYSLTLDPGKPVRAITLPKNPKVNILAISAVPVHGPSVTVSLSRAFNRSGIVPDGRRFAPADDQGPSGGFDHLGKSLSANQLGRELTCGGVKFDLGRVGTANVVEATGQRIPLPAGLFAKIAFVAAAVQGNQPDQVFVVQEADGALQRFTQGISDWVVAQHFKGETVAKATPYRNIADGKREGRMSPKVLSGHVYAVVGFDAKRRAVTLFNPLARDAGGPRIYAYSLPLEAGKTAVEITLPKNGHVNLLAMTAAPADGSGTPIDLSRAYNRMGITADGRDFKGGFDGGGYSLSGNLLGRELVWQGNRFPLGASGGLNVVQAAGQTIPLPEGPFSRLIFLAAAVYGNQPNQTFVVKRTDGSTRSFRRSISDWMTPQSYPGETVVSMTAYRNHTEEGEKQGKFTLTWGEFASSFEGTGHLSRPTSVLKAGK